jgi:hypothetical protein
LIEGIDALVSRAQSTQNTLKPNGNGELMLNYHSGEVPNYPFLDMTPVPHPLINFDTDVFFATRLGVMAAINMSLGIDSNAPFDEDEPVTIAIRAASDFIPVVMAAGNSGQMNDGRETMNAWAEPRWVISVGAVDVTNGINLADYSSVGVPNDPQSGPTIVADGSHPLPSERPGTSFAAPRVSYILREMAAFCLTLRHFVQLHQDDGAEGIPLVGFGIIDEDIPMPRKRELPLPALPRAGINTVAVAEVVSALRSRGVSVDTWPTPQRLREMLIACAEPLPKYKPHQVGHGFVNSEASQKYLKQFSGADFIKVFCPSLREETSLVEQLRGLKLTDTIELAYLINVWRQSALHCAFDYKHLRYDCIFR